MRTTVDLPDELYREAKTVAVERGIALKALFTGALRRELRSGPRGARKPSWVRATEALELDEADAESLRERIEAMKQDDLRSLGMGDDHWG